MSPKKTAKPMPRPLDWTEVQHPVTIRRFIVAGERAAIISDPNYHAAAAAGRNGPKDCFINVGGLTTAEVGVIITAFAGGPVGMLVVAAGLGFAAYSAVKACCPEYYGK